jgi:redox-sensing transcriptional repressor
MKTFLPQPTLIRLCAIYQFLCALEKEGVTRISSPELEKRTNIPSHTIRKDINFLGEIGCTGSGYDVAKLKEHIAEKLDFAPRQTACIVGLGNLGQAILNFPTFLSDGAFTIIVGFDSNINKLETIKTKVPLFPSCEIAEVVRKMAIKLAIVAVPATSAQEVCDRLVDGGISGIVNFAQTLIRPKREGVFIRNIDLSVECRILSVLAHSPSTIHHNVITGHP